MEPGAERRVTREGETRAARARRAGAPGTDLCRREATKISRVIVYDPPVGERRLVSDGCRYVYVTRWDGLDAKAGWGYLPPEA